jgi:DNA-binding transcriptional LysR family regulator
MLDVRRLEVLAAAVRERSIAAAARSLGITPSAASQAISALEAQAGTTLLDRKARGVVPTAAGERLALQAEAVIAQLAVAEAELAHEVPGTLAVAAFATAVSGLLPAALRQLRHHHVPLKVRITELEPEDARQAVRNRAADLALVNHDATLAPDATGPWRVVHLLDEPVYAVLPANHPRAGTRSVDLAQLAHDDWIMQAPASPCQELTVRACANAGFAPTVTATCSDYRSIVRLVAAGHGVSLVPRLATEHLDLSGVVTRPTRVPLTRRVNALVPADRAESASVRTFLALLREASARP